MVTKLLVGLVYEGWWLMVRGGILFPHSKSLSSVAKTDEDEIVAPELMSEGTLDRIVGGPFLCVQWLAPDYHIGTILSSYVQPQRRRD